MDRFIGVFYFKVICRLVYLKSNMDRFIGEWYLNMLCLMRFKIQYG